jgi:hypothetical protein
MLREKHKDRQPRGESTYALVWGGLACSSDAGPAMGPAILPALLVCFIAGKAADRKVLWRQLSIALLVFAMAFGPAVPLLQTMIRTSSTHVFYEPPRPTQLVSTVTVHRLVIVLGIFLAVAAFRRQLDWRGWDVWMLLICTSLVAQPVKRFKGRAKGHGQKTFVALGRLLQKLRTGAHGLIVECPRKRHDRYGELVITELGQNSALRNRD